MKLLDTLSIALRNLLRRKLRAVLTVLGLVIGVAAIVVMVSLGIGINEYFMESYQEMGDLTTIDVVNYRTERAVSSGGSVMISQSSNDIVLDKKAVDAIKQIDGVVAVMPMLETGAAIKSGQYSTGMSLRGVDLSVAEQFGIQVGQGELPGPASGSTYEIAMPERYLQYFYNDRTGKEAINKDGTPKLSMNSKFQMTFDWSNLYDYGDDYGGEARPKGKMYKLRVTGLFPMENYSMYYAIMDINAMKKLAKENKDFMGLETDRFSTIKVKCADMDQVLKIQEQIINMGYGAESSQQYLEQAKESMSSLQMLLGAIGGVALLVAAIGIMNTMMMSIYERTKEIGIIKVLGCRMRNIAGQFLCESAYIGLFGGALGLGVSYGISWLLNNVLFANDTMGMGSMMRSSIPPYLALGALAFSIVVAILSGMYPALRAMRLSVLTAIRNE